MKSKELFVQSMAKHMVKHFSVQEDEAKEMANKHANDIDTEDVTVQQLGPDYFAIQILMAEKVIPYRPM